MHPVSLAVRDIYPESPPDFQTRDQINPTLMMSWWATVFSLVIIIVRLFGRYVRIERFFPEDMIMMVSVVPLTIRMVLVHFVLVWGTNNTKTEMLTADEVAKRELGSKLVLAARIFYAIFIWTAKLTVCEFLKRVTGMVWRRSVAVFLWFIHFFLVSTLVAVVIATLAECQPFNHYWQVIPDPGPACRAAHGNLITMGTCDVITDLLLIAFPVPIVLTAQMPVKRKLALVALFCLSLVLVAITCYRVPSVIEHHGAQPYRSLLASLEILAATAVSNIVVIGSFVRDRGVKKLKYKPDHGRASVSDSLENGHVRRTTVMKHQWGSDSDLAADLGIRLDPKLYPSASLSSKGSLISRPAPAAPAPSDPMASAQTGSLDSSWNFQSPSDDHTSGTDSFDLIVRPHEYIQTDQSPRENHLTSASAHSTSRQLSFFDVGGLLNQNEPDSHCHPDTAISPDLSSATDLESQRPTRSSRAFLEDLGVVAPRSGPSS